MLASQYIRNSLAAQVMVKWLDDKGLPWVVEKPGSKGHPFLIISAKDKKVRVPFASSPSDNARGHKNALRDMKRQLREAGVEDEILGYSNGHDDEPEAEPEQEAAPVIHRTAEGAPIRCGDPKAYRQARDAYIAERANAGDTAVEIARKLAEGGDTIKPQSIQPMVCHIRKRVTYPIKMPSYNDEYYSHRTFLRAQEQEQAGGGGGDKAPPPAEAAQDDKEPAPCWKAAVKAIIAEAREKNYDEADAAMREAMGELVEIRSQVEADAMTARNARILDALTS